MNPDIFVELSIVLAVTILITGIILLLRQPAIIGYILSGVIAGPVFLNLISSTDTFTALAQKGVALLLFLVGLNMNPKVIRDVGKISIVTGLGQVVFTATVGFFISKLLGFSTTVSLYIAIALTFSSTIVIMKLLSDKKDLESLYAKISIGFLIVQDFIVIFLLLGISSFGAEGNFSALLIETIVKGVLFIFALVVLAIHVLPKITKFIAKSREFLFLFSISWCFAIATISHNLGFSIEAGALLAGISLSVSPYHFEIGSKMRPLRDFFLILFFVMLGSQMVFDNLLTNIVPIVLLSLFVLIGNPLIVMVLMGALGYTKRNGFMAGLTVAQISEFSLVFVALGVSLGHAGGDILSMVTAIALITFACSTYMIMYSSKLYGFLGPYLSVFEKEGRKADEDYHIQESDHDLILLGYNRIGYDVLESFKRTKKRLLIIDHNPEVIARLLREGFDCKYGDANNSELLDDLKPSKAKMIVSTIADLETNLLVINKIRSFNKNSIIVVVAHHVKDALKLYNEGATYVIMPHLLGGSHFSDLLNKHKFNLKKFLDIRSAHIKHISKRKRIAHSS